MGEAVVSRGALCALAADDVLPAGTLSSNWIAGAARGAGSVTVAWQSSIIVGCHERAGRVSAEL